MRECIGTKGGINIIASLRARAAGVRLWVSREGLCPRAELLMYSLMALMLFVRNVCQCDALIALRLAASLIRGL